MQQCRSVLTIYGETCQAALNCHWHRAAADREGLAEYCGRGMAHRLAPLAALIEDRRKHSAAKVSKVVAEATSQAVGDALDEYIADVAAMGVVHVTQMLDVENDDCRAVLFDPKAQQMVEMFAE